MISGMKEAVMGGDRYFQQDDHKEFFWGKELTFEPRIDDEEATL